jgi:hypothetical protein
MKDDSRYWTRATPTNRKVRKELLGSLGVTLSDYRARPELLSRGPDLVFLSAERFCD